MDKMAFSARLYESMSTIVIVLKRNPIWHKVRVTFQKVFGNPGDILSRIAKITLSVTGTLCQNGFRSNPITIVVTALADLIDHFVL